MITPIAEELFFRGLLLRALEKRFNTTIAIVVSAVVFGSLHITGVTSASNLAEFAVQGLFIAVVITGYGLVFALLDVYTGRLCAVDHRSYGHQRHWCGELSGHMTDNVHAAAHALVSLRRGARTFRARWKRVIGVGVMVTVFTVTVGTLLDLMFEHKAGAERREDRDRRSRWRALALERGQRVRYDVPFRCARPHRRRAPTRS